jgi:hypothetical protein
MKTQEQIEAMAKQLQSQLSNNPPPPNVASVLSGILEGLNWVLNEEDEPYAVKVFNTEGY